MPRRWDDWKCYRCNQWRPGTMLRRIHTTPSGITVAVCSECAEDYNEQDGGVSADPDTIRGGPGPELTPRAGAAPRHEGKS